MCAIIGVVLDNPSSDELESVKRVFLESRIRGMHATGISFIKNGEVRTIKEAIPADEFISSYMSDMEQFVEDGKLFMVGHCRYSTSDLQYNQPIATQNVSVVHNGVITQELPEKWKDIYGYDTETHNDSELILHTIKEGKSPLEEWSDSSLAVIELYEDYRMRFYRNGKRPMYLTNMPSGSIITSTRDVPLRAGIMDMGVSVPMNTYSEFNKELTMTVNVVKIDGAKDLQL